MAVCALARLSNKPRSTRRRSMRRRRVMRLLSNETTNGAQRAGLLRTHIGTNNGGLLLFPLARYGPSRRAGVNPARIRTEENHGTTIFARRFEGRRARNAQAPTRDAPQREKRKKGKEPQAGNRHRPFGSSPQRKKGAAQRQKIAGRVEALIRVPSSPPRHAGSVRAPRTPWQRFLWRRGRPWRTSPSANPDL